MSTKIDSTPTSLPPSPSPLSTSKLAAKSAYVSVETGAGTRSNGRGDDTVEITGDAMKMQSLEKSLSGTTSFDAKKVAEVRQRIADGQYQINPERIAERLVTSDALLG
ncbi:flagellar biosynthesis anti-sigma factor FlgM [Hydrocarboniphaga sp.]|uniref:flagellar biosynthesis anti-sigma factor FlgM n=1 Tax=Hydrocarboniphaga sp. TaxID=2033016 RepID=UPI003D14CEDA